MSTKVMKSPAVEETLMQEPSYLLVKLLSFGAVMVVTIWSFSSLNFTGINQLGLQIVKNL